MFKNYLKGIEGIATYPMFSLLVFVIFFLAVFIYTVRADKNRLMDISKLPLDNNDERFKS